MPSTSVNSAWHTPTGSSWSSSTKFITMTDQLQSKVSDALTDSPVNAANLASMLSIRPFMSSISLSNFLVFSLKRFRKLVTSLFSKPLPVDCNESTLPFNAFMSSAMDDNSTVVKRMRVPAGSLVKMATDADVDSGRKMTLMQSVEAYAWIVLSGKIHGGIRNIQCKSRLRGTFHCCTIAPRKNIFWRGCFVFMFCRCRGYLYFFTRVPDLVTRVPALYKGAWFVCHFHYRVFHRTLVAQTRQQTCER